MEPRVADACSNPNSSGRSGEDDLGESCDDLGYSNVYFTVDASLGVPATAGGVRRTCTTVHVVQLVDAALIAELEGHTCDGCSVVIAEADGSDSEALWCRDCGMFVCPWCWPPWLEKRVNGIASSLK